MFMIDSNSGSLFMIGKPRAESVRSYNLLIRVTDGFHQADTKVILICNTLKFESLSWNGLAKAISLFIRILILSNLRFQFSVRIKDVNDNRPLFESPVYNVSVPEDAKVGTRIMQLTASDGDSDDSNRNLVYSVVQAASKDSLARFTVSDDGKYFTRFWLNPGKNKNYGPLLSLSFEVRIKWI